MVFNEITCSLWLLEFCQTFQTLLKDSPKTPISDLLCKTFLETDNQMSKRKELSAGTTAIVAFVRFEERDGRQRVSCLFLMNAKIIILDILSETESFVYCECRRCSGCFKVSSYYFRKLAFCQSVLKKHSDLKQSKWKSNSIVIWSQRLRSLRVTKSTRKGRVYAQQSCQW